MLASGTAHSPGKSGPGGMHFWQADSDSSSEEGLTAVEDLAAQKTVLVLRLRRWDSQFESMHGRKAKYEDRKLARDYQQLRARLRDVEIQLKLERGKIPEPEFDDEIMSMSSSSSFRSADSSLTSRSTHLSSTIADEKRAARQSRALARETLSKGRPRGTPDTARSAGGTQRSMSKFFDVDCSTRRSVANTRRSTARSSAGATGRAAASQQMSYAAKQKAATGLSMQEDDVGDRLDIYKVMAACDEHHHHHHKKHSDKGAKAGGQGVNGAAQKADSRKPRGSPARAPTTGARAQRAASPGVGGGQGRQGSPRLSRSSSPGDRSNKRSNERASAQDKGVTKAV